VHTSPLSIVDRLAMSGFGTSRTWRDVRVESAFGGAADVAFRGC
jgi:hypothetical protein